MPLNWSCSTKSNSIEESEVSLDSHTKQTENRFVCQFHGQNIVSKSITKNKFFCDACLVNPNYTEEYNYPMLAEDLM